MSMNYKSKTGHVKSNVKRKSDRHCHVHYVKRVRICSFSGPYFPAFGLNTERYVRSIPPCSVRIWENTDQKNYEYEHFSQSGWYSINNHWKKTLWKIWIKQYKQL